MAKKEKDNFRFSTAILLILFAGFLVGAIGNFMASPQDLFYGFIFLGLAFFSLGLMIWAYFNPFVPMLVGCIFYSVMLLYLYITQWEMMLGLERVNVVFIGGIMAFWYGARDGWIELQYRKNKVN